MTITPHRYDFVIWQGTTHYDPFAIESSSGTTFDLASEGDGYTVGRLTIRDEIGGEEIVSLTTDNGGIVIDYFTDSSGTWSGYIFMSAAATAELNDWGDGVYDMEIATSTGPSARVERPFHGRVRLGPEATT